MKVRAVDTNSYIRGLNDGLENKPFNERFSIKTTTYSTNDCWDYVNGYSVGVKKQLNLLTNELRKRVLRSTGEV